MCVLSLGQVPPLISWPMYSSHRKNRYMHRNHVPCRCQASVDLGPVSVSGQCRCQCRACVGPVSVSGQCRCRCLVSVSVGAGVGPVSVSFSVSGQCGCRCLVSVGVGAGVGPVSVSLSVSGQCRCRCLVNVGVGAGVGVGPVPFRADGFRKSDFRWRDFCRVGVVSVSGMWISSLSLFLSVLHFSSVQDGICALGNAQLRCTPFLCCSWRNKTKGSATLLTPLLKPGVKEHNRQRSKECTSHFERTSFLRL